MSNAVPPYRDMLPRVPYVPAQMGDFWQLLKPRVMRLVVFTAVCGMVLAPGELHIVQALVAVVAIAVNAGAAGALNMWYERDIDAKMQRTSQRPIVKGRVAADDALGFGIFLSLGSFALMGLSTNWLAAGLLMGANFFYVFVYTIWLKRLTPQNIVIGGAAGAFPPMIGWAAVTGDISPTAMILFMIIFLWTPPHFWALSLFINRDYEKANIPMMNVVAGPRSTKWQMLLYTLLLIPVSMVPSLLGSTGGLYALVALLLGVLFLGLNIAVLFEREGAYTAAKRMFGYSIIYLFILFAAMVFDRTEGMSLLFSFG